MFMCSFYRLNFCHVDTAMLDGKPRKYNGNKTTDQLRRSLFPRSCQLPDASRRVSKLIVKEQIVYGVLF